MRRAIADAGVEPNQVNYINAHGTSTPYNDKFETIAIKKVFGEFAKTIPVSSTKSMTGHLLGATGAVEAAVCVKAIQTGEIPPTINYETPDPECDLDYVPNVKRSAKVDVAVSNNLATLPRRPRFGRAAVLFLPIAARFAAETRGGAALGRAARCVDTDPPPPTIRTPPL